MGGGLCEYKDDYKITKDIDYEVTIYKLIWSWLMLIESLANVNIVEFQSLKHSSVLIDEFQLTVEREEKLQKWSCQRPVEVESAKLMRQEPVEVGAAQTS